jgi:glutaredoxin-like protein
MIANHHPLCIASAHAGHPHEKGIGTMSAERFQNREGTRVPAVDFKVITDGSLGSRSSAEIFAGRSVVVFSLPGAYTPTCSSAHLPRFDELAPVLADLGVDEVVCLSVNDAFVMDAWARDQQVRHVTLLADGNGEFSRGMGLLVDKSDLGFGKRSWRYSMLVRDGVVEKQFIEPDVAGDPFEVSDADTMLRYLDPQGRAEELTITLFTKAGCAHCARARQMLRERGMGFEEVSLGHGLSTSTLRAVSGRSTTPQVFVNGGGLGGADELAAWLESRDVRAA